MVIAQQRISLALSVEQAASLISRPEAILDYYPLGGGGESLEAGAALTCWSKSLFGLATASYLSVQTVPQHWPAIDGTQPDLRVVLKVDSALLSSLDGKAPYSATRIRQRAFFTMWEDWRLYRVDEQHCVLEKLWLDLTRHKWRMVPIKSIVVLTAAKESRALQQAWDKRSS